MRIFTKKKKKQNTNDQYSKSIEAFIKFIVKNTDALRVKQRKFSFYQA